MVWAHCMPCPDDSAAGTARPARHRQNTFMKLAIAFEGGVLGGLVVGDMHVARKGNTHRVVGAPARRALGLEKGNAVTDDIERCELVEEQIVAAHGHAANGRGAAGAHPQRWVRFLANSPLLRNRGLGPLAVTGYPPAAGRVAGRKVLKRAFCSSLSD